MNYTTITNGVTRIGQTIEKFKINGNLYIYEIKLFLMKPLLPARFVLPIGLLLLSIGIILKNFNLIPDFADGFLAGLGGTLIVASFVKKWYVNRAD